MKYLRISLLLTLLPFFIATLFVTSSQGALPGKCSAAERNSSNPSDSSESLQISLELKDASAKEGIRLRVVFENSGPGASSLNVCPSMLLCCVKGLHPMITCEDTGIGLLDVCTVSKPTSHEVYLPGNSAFSFELNIPADRLPTVCLEKGKELSVYVCYETDEQKTLRSNALKVVLK